MPTHSTLTPVRSTYRVPKHAKQSGTVGLGLLQEARMPTEGGLVYQA